jgi:hypothetical protein
MKKDIYIMPATKQTTDIPKIPDLSMTQELAFLSLMPQKKARNLPLQKKQLNLERGMKVNKVDLHCEPEIERKKIAFTHSVEAHFNEISIEFNEPVLLTDLSISISFDQKILAWRNFDYTWTDCSKDRFSNYYSPKILKLEDGTKVVGGITEGIWHFEKNHPEKLTWSIVEPWATPVFQYGEKNIRNFVNTPRLFSDKLTLRVYNTKNNVEEWSRSPLPFAGTICFTDHCDFDTLGLLKKQREVFKNNNIKVTKGIFQYHYSKRGDNCSLDKPEELEEYKKWVEDGHQLAYHSITQTKKPGSEPFEDFEKFGLTIADTDTWIDHGYQPYNFTQIANNPSKFNEERWIRHIKNKGVNCLWSYLDSGETARGIINQLNPESFRYEKLYNSVSKASMKVKVSERIRLFLFYFTNEDKLLKYRNLSSNIKNFAKAKNIMHVFSMMKLLPALSGSISNALAPGSEIRNAIPRFSKWCPALFKIKVGTPDEITFFQTVAVKDYPGTFSEENLSTLMKEGGLCIAHTYFAFLENHHQGRMFKDKQGNMSNDVVNTFQQIGSKISSGEIWNPTFSELAKYYDLFRFLEYEFNESDGSLKLKSNSETNNIPKRNIE